MNINRAPRGIPTGGQFVASSRSEPTVSLSHDIAGKAAREQEQEPAAMRSIGFTDGGRTIMDWDTRTEVDYDSLSDSERVHVDRVARERGYPDPRRSELRKAAEKIGDEISDTVDAFSEVAGHIADVQRGNVPAPEAEGNFVGWGQMLPKFMRRKNGEAKASEPEQESLEARNRRLAKVFGDAARAAEQMDSAASRMRELSGDR